MRIVFLSYLINPSLAPNAPARKRRDVYRDKYGEETAARMFTEDDPLLARFRKAGIEPHPDGDVGSTYHAHRLLLHTARAAGQDVAIALKLALLDAHWVKGRALNERDVLLEAATAVGVLDADKVIDDPTALAAELDDALEANRRRAGGVPAFFVGKRTYLGVQPPSKWTKIFADAPAVEDG